MGEGTVNDEELVEVMAKAIACEWDTNGTGTFIPATVFAIVARDALRSAGFQVFKPEDCERYGTIATDDDGNTYTKYYYRVPADSGGSG